VRNFVTNVSLKLYFTFYLKMYFSLYCFNNKQGYFICADYVYSLNLTLRFLQMKTKISKNIPDLPVNLVPSAAQANLQSRDKCGIRE